MYLLNVFVILFVSSYLLKTINADGLNSLITTKEYNSNLYLMENVTMETYKRSDEVQNQHGVSSHVLFLKQLEKTLWKFVPLFLLTIGIIGNALTIAIMRR